ncbi:uncharacterized protein [Rutidosis leptorrhynchoides]|uniref:uncharacterized protein n=1 Tax=Rutidosis leptorrhynchoides TaxID=125765 RepID=UPI003A99655C
MSRPEDVFDKTFEFLSVDVVHPNRPGTKIGIELLKDLTLQEIERLLQCNSTSLRNFSSMPFPSYNTRDISENHLIIDELSYDKSTGAVFFLYGYGGTGKTFLWKTLTAALQSKEEIVLNVAKSGIAALLLSGGRTAHSRFRIPLQPTDESFCTIKSDNNLAELIRRAKLIIWDEAPMVNNMCVEALDRSFRDIYREINPNSMDTIFGDYVTVLKLTVNMILGGIGASSTDADTRMFVEWILEIGNGNVGESEDGVFDIEIQQDLLIIDSVDPIGSMISTIYPEYLLNLANPQYYQQRAILAPTHEVVDIINDRMKHCLEVGGLPKHNLRLKVGVPVMLLRNVDQAGGLCNGTRLQVISLGERMIKEKNLTGSNVGKITAISRDCLLGCEDDDITYMTYACAPKWRVLFTLRWPHDVKWCYSLFVGHMT